MNKQKALKYNQFIYEAYKAGTFTELLRYVILNLHETVMYESGMFFCGISQDCSFFKPYIRQDGSRSVEDYYQKREFPDKEEYLRTNDQSTSGKEPLVYSAAEYQQGLVKVINEPRNTFLTAQREYHIICIRIVNDGQFLGEIYLHRSTDKPDFDEEDLFLLRMMQPHISNVFGLIHTNNTLRYMEANEQFRSQKGVCIFDDEMNLTGGNVAGLDMLKWVTSFNSSVLYHIRESCLEILEKKEIPTKDHAGCVRSSLKVGKGSLNYSIYFSVNPVVRKSEFLAVMEFASQEQMTDDYRFKFTKREADVIDGLLQGKTNIQISHQLNISENTVRSHVKNVYQKTGVNNRTELTYLMMKS